MRLTPENKRKITDRIRAGAAKTLREHGFDAVNLDKLMKEAGLTRGAFYAHFPSKGALLAEVMRHEHPLLTLLENRPGPGPGDLRDQLLEVFAGYLDVRNLEDVFRGCTLAALTGDATRAPDVVKEAYGDAFQAICVEMGRGQKHGANAYCPALLIASGAVRSAMAMQQADRRAQVLSAAHDAFRLLLPE